MTFPRSNLVLRTVAAVLLAFILSSLAVAFAQETEPPPAAEIVNPEGGPVDITGELTYTNPRFTTGVAEPVIILEDQAGFVDRNKRFLMPVESQTLGQITSDFYTSPFSYSIALPLEPQGTLRDVDNDGEADTGVQIFAIAYWNNTFGDPYLEERDLFGGGWSTAYASTRVSEDADTEGEVIGGKYLVYAPDAAEGFPSGFGEDGLLFTEDDPIVSLPQGYTVVDMDTTPFTFDRSSHPVIDLIEPEGAALTDFSDLSYTEAFDALVDLLSKKYAFTEYKNIDWEAKRAAFHPRFEEADAQGDTQGYLEALRDFAWSIPDGHISGPFLVDQFRFETGGGLGIAIRQVDDGRVLVNFVLEDSPADQAGIKLGTEIISLNGVPIDEAVDNAVAWSAPFSTEHFEHLQKLRYAVRFPIGTEVQVTFLNSDSDVPETATLTAVGERESFNFSSFNAGLTGFELPVEYQLLEDSGYGYVKINSFSDNSLLSVQLWERMMRTLNQNLVPGLIIDMRQNGGGSGFLADQMAAYFFNEPHVLGNTGHYDEKRDAFYFDPRYEDRFYLPAEELRYNGKVTVLIGPNCNSACEFFTYDMTVDDRATIVGQYPTAGLGGSVALVLMPDQELFQYTSGRAVNNEGEIHIEGKGVPPDVRVPVTEETLFSQGDPVLDAAVNYLDDQLAIETIDGGEIQVGQTTTGVLAPGARVRYLLQAKKGDVINIYVEAQDETLDPLLSLYDEGDNLLVSNDDASAETANPALEDLEIPFDLVLFVEVSSVNDTGEGAFTLRVEESPSAQAKPQAELTQEPAETPTTVPMAEPTTESAAEGSETAQMDILGTLQASGDFNSLMQAIRAAGLEEELTRDGPFTLFAPNDEAFARLPEGTLEGWLNDPETLATILRYHVVAGKITAENLAQLNAVTVRTGEAVAVETFGDDIVLGGEAEVIGEDLTASNGVIHVIDSVLLPPGVELPAGAVGIVQPQR